MTCIRFIQCLTVNIEPVSISRMRVSSGTNTNAWICIIILVYVSAPVQQPLSVVAFIICSCMCWTLCANADDKPYIWRLSWIVDSIEILCGRIISIYYVWNPWTCLCMHLHSPYSYVVLRLIVVVCSSSRENPMMMTIPSIPRIYKIRFSSTNLFRSICLTTIFFVSFIFPSSLRFHERFFAINDILIECVLKSSYWSLLRISNNIHLSKHNPKSSKRTNAKGIDERNQK